LIVPDADLASVAPLLAACDETGLACAFLVAPTSTPERVRSLATHSRGFVYLLARAGITGETSTLPDLRAQAAAIRAAAPRLPIAAGFGIATAAQVRAAVAEVDGAIVGSAIVRRVRDEVAAGRDPAPAVEALVRDLVDAARSAQS
jgi:tryptophan synthase alpha chain